MENLYIRRFELALFDVWRPIDYSFGKTDHQAYMISRCTKKKHGFRSSISQPRPTVFIFSVCFFTFGLVSAPCQARVKLKLAPFCRCAPLSMRMLHTDTWCRYLILVLQRVSNRQLKHVMYLSVSAAEIDITRDRTVDPDGQRYRQVVSISWVGSVGRAWVS